MAAAHLPLLQMLKHEQVKALVDAAVTTYGRIDVIINNAGLMPQSPLDRYKLDEWNQI